MHDNLEATFTTEAVDRQWGPGAQRQVQDRLRGLVPDGSAVRSIECRTSMCRIETEHASLEELDRFTRAAFMEPNTRVWNAGGMSHTEMPARPGDPIRAIAFLAREGTALAVE
jgi:hypothetical protein